MIFPGDDGSNPVTHVPREFVEIALRTLNEIGHLHTPADFHYVCSAIVKEDHDQERAFD